MKLKGQVTIKNITTVNGITDREIKPTNHGAKTSTKKLYVLSVFQYQIGNPIK